MKILFISDIHANYPALEVLEKYIKDSDLTICLGDIVGYHCYVNEVIDFLRKHKVVCIQGNHDRYIFESLEKQTKLINDSVKFGIDIANKLINAANKEWLQHLPTSFSFKTEERSILCSHGSPWDPTNGYVYADSDLFSKMSEFKYDVIALGHTHREYIKQTNNQLIFNPGSVGQARDHEGYACAKIVDTKTMSLETLHLLYDYKKTIDYSISYGAQDWIYKHFMTIIR